jgi:hypothetical protein
MVIAIFIAEWTPVLFLLSIAAYVMLFGKQSAFNESGTKLFLFMWAHFGSAFAVIALASILFAWRFPDFAATQRGMCVSTLIGASLAAIAVLALNPLYYRLIVHLETD